MFAITTDHENGAPSEKASSFFMKMPHRFNQVELSQNEGIPTQPFLNSCRAIVPIFDLLGPTLFSPVKMDIEGNISKLETKYQLDKNRFNYLQEMALQELQDPEASQINNATDALLWLKRALEFINEFFQEFLSGNPSLSDAANKAYSRTLKEFHGYLVQGIFYVVIRAVPSRTSFANMLVPLQECKTETEQTLQILEDSKDCFVALQNILRILNSFYKQHNLDNDTRV